MAINSQDKLVAALAAGQTWINAWNKLALPATLQTVGAWYDLSKGGGNLHKTLSSVRAPT